MFNVQSIEKIKFDLFLIFLMFSIVFKHIKRSWPDASYMSKCLPQYSDLSPVAEKRILAIIMSTPMQVTGLCEFKVV